MKQGDITIQGQADILPNQRLAEIVKDLTDATVDTAYTGFGFKPRNMWFIGNVNATVAEFVGMAGTGGSVCINRVAPGDLGSWYNDNCIYLETGASAYQIARILSIDSDGFTLRRTKNGSPTGTGRIFYMALK